MRRVLVPKFAALDGVMEAPAGEEGHRLARLFPETPDKAVLMLVDTKAVGTGVVSHADHRA